jgi:type I restriction enzyme S subunit
MEVETMKSDVGMSWDTIRLGEIVRIKTGKLDANASSVDGAYPFFTCSKEPLKISKFSYDCECVLVAGNGDLNVKYYNGKFDAYQRTYIVECSDNTKLNARYLFYFLDTYLEKLREQSIGGVIKYIKSENLTEVQIPLPPLATQKRIAEILNAADALKRKDQELLKKYDDLAQAIFIDMFGDPVKNEKGWEVKTIDQLVKKTKHSIKRGPFGGALKKEIFVDDGYLVYEQFHALNNDFTFGRYYITQEKYNELIAFDVKPGDIIISCSGIYLGKLAIIPEGVKPGIINQALLKLTLDESIYRNEFFVKVFTQENFKETYFASERGAAIPNFPPMATFKEFKFICPPIKIQNDYLKLVENLQNQIDTVLIEQKKANILFQTLIQKAFKGELVE